MHKFILIVIKKVTYPISTANGQLRKADKAVENTASSYFL